MTDRSAEAGLESTGEAAGGSAPVSGPLRVVGLGPAIRSRFVAGINGLRMHLLEAGWDDGGRPLLLLLHGFPELAYSWRKVMEPLAAAGFHVVAPDQRGYGRTTGWDGRYDGDVDSFRLLAIARDALALVVALGRREVAAVVGHDFGSPVAACCALARPDVFRRAVLMSAPFPGPPSLPDRPAGPDVHGALAALPRPRKHYQWYYSTRAAEADMLGPPEGLHAFLRAYYHMKSADWPGNAPVPLAGWNAAELAHLPTYYVMDAGATMPESVRAALPSPEAIAGCRWLPDAELAVYAAEFARTGLQGALNWYRCGTEGRNADLGLFAGRPIEVPVTFVAGRQDWGIFQKPGEIERMQREACRCFAGLHLVDGAGHWVQQERPEAVVRIILEATSRVD